MGDIFHCRRFSLSNSRAGLKVGTDGVLLGAAVDLEQLGNKHWGSPESALGHTSGGSDAATPDYTPGRSNDTALISCDAGGSDSITPEHTPCLSGGTAPEITPGRSDEDSGRNEDRGGVQAAGLPGPLRILDIGTGTGIIALILAQRLQEMGLDFWIDAIDINPEAAAEAAENFAASPWADRMRAQAVSLQNFKPEGKYDLIVSNPPYYDNSPKAGTQAREGARHAATLSWRDVAAFAAGNLLPPGPLCLILPADQELALRRYAASFGLYPRRLLRIRTTVRKAPSRLIAEFTSAAPASPAAATPSSLTTRMNPVPIEEELTIQDGPYFTPEYINLVKDIYIDKKISSSHHF